MMVVTMGPNDVVGNAVDGATEVGGGDVMPLGPPVDEMAGAGRTTRLTVTG